MEKGICWKSAHSEAEPIQPPLSHHEHLCNHSFFALGQNVGALVFSAAGLGKQALGNAEMKGKVKAYVSYYGAPTPPLPHLASRAPFTQAHIHAHSCACMRSHTHTHTKLHSLKHIPVKLFSLLKEKEIIPTLKHQEAVSPQSQKYSQMLSCSSSQ